ncbi:helix-turn-helix transcriptional regulator [Paenibacillus tritici]|uniref:Helix-turn-helix transcriptional regulator n=1 Tax=Paenibacillus tritici TaxID=1873425 RepID=A0ABX2DSJ4_9BACL|nr:helix-turn-helix transcriptional regulator [Paenibacillus tritici]NQX47557.1 helix-turn-helix transcriptional regulator [Paenibacillus tritici]
MKKKGKLVNNLHILRAEKRWTQDEVAKKLDVSRMTISSIEGNRYSPSLILAFEIARLFDKEITEVFRYVTHEEDKGGGDHV